MITLHFSIISFWGGGLTASLFTILCIHFVTLFSIHFISFYFISLYIYIFILLFFAYRSSALLAVFLFFFQVLPLLGTPPSPCKARETGDSYGCVPSFDVRSARFCFGATTACRPGKFIRGRKKNKTNREKIQPRAPPAQWGRQSPQLTYRTGN